MELNQFFILHHPKGSDFHSSGKWLHWQTCLRSIEFGANPDPSFHCLGGEGLSEFYQGSSAIRFLMEVVCGLKSPMVGETEVFGQYKKFIDTLAPKTNEQFEIKNLLIEVRNHCKKIRSRHLINLGAQSYGSLLRKKIDFSKPIHIIGAGQFAEEIAPWLSKKSQQIFIHSRNPDKAKKKPSLSLLHHFSVQSSPPKKEGCLIIAAPLSAHQISRWVGIDSFDVIFDLRGKSSQDPLLVTTKKSNLDDFFKLINNNKQSIVEKVAQAQRNISDIISDKLNEQKLNPFGWDDLCT